MPLIIQKQQNSSLSTLSRRLVQSLGNSESEKISSSANMVVFIQLTNYLTVKQK